MCLFIIRGTKTCLLLLNLHEHNSSVCSRPCKQEECDASLYY